MLIAYSKIAINFGEISSSVTIMCVCLRQELLQILAEACLYPVGSEVAAACIQPSFDCLLVSYG